MSSKRDLAARRFRTLADNIKINHQLQAYLASPQLSGEPGELQLPQVRRQLLNAAFGEAASKPGLPGGRWSGRLVISASLAVAVAVAAIAVLSLHGSATPPSGSAAGPPGGAPPRAWINALARASQSTRQHDPACQPPAPTRSHHRHFFTSAPPQRISAIIASLATPARGTRRIRVKEPRRLHVDGNGIYARYAWQGHADGVHYYIVPAAIVGMTKQVPARCYRQEVAAFRREAQRFPVQQRAAAIAYGQQQFNPKAAAGVAVMTIGYGTEGESNCPSLRLAQLKTQPASCTGGGGNDQSTTTTVLVPSSVASVTARYPASSYPGHVDKTFTVTKRPVRNFVIFHLAGAWDPPQLTFRSRAGAVIQSMANR